MSIKINDHDQTVTLSVTDLCGDELCSGSLNRTPLRDIRGKLGREVHQYYQSKQARTFPGYRVEEPISHELEMDGFHVIIQGRLDGVYRDEGFWVIEEMKSTLGRSQPADDLIVSNTYLLQLRLYIYLWSRIHGDDRVRGRLVIISCSDQHSSSIDVSGDPPVMKNFLETQIRKVLREVRRTLQKDKEEESNRRIRPLLFPFPQMRRHQEKMIEAIESALQSHQPLLVSAPTGIGKTVAALFASLRFSRHHGSSVFFLTSKTTQQRIVADTLKLWDLVPEELETSGRLFTGLVLRAKEKICANDVVCCHGSRCTYAQDFYGKMEKANLRHELASLSLITPDLVYETAVKNEICPFELSMELVPEADLILCDYNYLYDPRITLRRRFVDNSRPPIVIIDEAHNLYSRAREFYSPRLDLAWIQNLKQNLLTEMKPLLVTGKDIQADLSGLGRNQESIFIEDLLSCLTVLEDYFARVRQDYQESINIDSDQSCIVLDTEFFNNVREQFDRLLRRYLLDRQRGGAWKEDDEFLELAHRINDFCTVLQIKGNEFIHLFDGTGKSDQLRILCLNPGPCLEKRHKTFHSVVAMSATLSPLEFYRDVLGFDRNAELLSLPSPFPPENQRVVVVSEVSTLYRQRTASAPRIAQIIEKVVAVHPGNYLTFFPSFDFLRIVVPYINPPGYRLLVQERIMGDHSRDGFLEELAEDGQPHLLLGVQGGVFAEGVDYPGNMAVGVIIVGPGLPKIGCELELTRRYFEEEYSQGFEYACLFPGMNRVVQSAGRVIRSETDRGVIVLIGKRFRYENYMNLFPRGWYDASPTELISKSYVDELERFWA